MGPSHSSVSADKPSSRRGGTEGSDETAKRCCSIVRVPRAPQRVLCSAPAAHCATVAEHAGLLLNTFITGPVPPQWPHSTRPHRREPEAVRCLRRPCGLDDLARQLADDVLAAEYRARMHEFITTQEVASHMGADRDRRVAHTASQGRPSAWCALLQRPDVARSSRVPERRRSVSGQSPWVAATTL